MASGSKRSLGTSILLVAAIAGTYFLGAKFGFSLATDHLSVSPAWPPSGVAVGSVLLFGPFATLGVFLGAFIVNDLLTSVGFLVSLGIALGNTAEALTAYFLLRTLVPQQNYFSNLRNVIWFFTMSCVVSTAVSATIGNFVLWLKDPSLAQMLPSLWLTWWLGDATGILLIVPLVFALIQGRPWIWNWTEVKEFLAICSMGLVVCHLTFGIFPNQSILGTGYPLAFLVPPLLFWTALRLSPLAIALVMLMISATAIDGSIRGVGPFSLYGQNASILILNIFLFGCAIPAYVLSALVSERGRYYEELKEQQDHLKVSETRFRQLAENVREMFYIIDVKTGLFNYVSSACRNVWHRAQDKFFKDLDHLIAEVHPTDRAILRASFLRNQQGEETSVEYRVLLPNGHTNWISDRAFPVRDEKGRVYRIAGIAEDITLRKEIDQELRSKADELMRVNSELDHYASMASHDLRAPLRTVSGFATLISRKLEGTLDEETREYLNFVTAGCKQMGLLIEDLLRKARLGGKGDIPTEVDLNLVVKQACESYQAQLLESKTRVDCEELPKIVFDPMGIKEIIFNLVGNAIKYRGAQSPVVHISAERKELAWTIIVQDNGIGIPLAAHERIFQPFVRLHTQDAYEGTGIGLATCKKLVERRGGKIWVESQEGKGSTFFFSVPDNIEVDAQSGILSNASNLSISSLAESPNEILIVEDNPADSNIIEILLKRERLPFKIRLVSNGEEALNFLKRRGVYSRSARPAVILLDLNLPKIGGLELLKQIKADSDLKHIPVIVVSSSASLEDIQKSYDLAAACYITKPRDLNGYRELVQLIRRFWLERVELPKNKADEIR